jgi:predicted GNAT superfamily acetyltransferase
MNGNRTVEQVQITVLDAGAARWLEELETCRQALAATQGTLLFPPHFLRATFHRIGGKLALATVDDVRVAVGFLFPRHLQAQPPHRRTYTLRVHWLAAPDPSYVQQVVEGCAAALDGAQMVYYDPAGPHSYYQTHHEIGAVDIGRPDAAEAAASRQMQRQVWGADEATLYPADLHSAEFGAGTSLVARVDGKPAGFLFGFYRFDGSALPADWSQRFGGAFRLESQTLAVLPEHRGLRIANLLKKFQADRAFGEGIRIVNWTSDPLQYPNAALNFGLLRAVSFEFLPDMYAFRNELNRVNASRLALTWLVGAERVRETPLIGARANVLDLRRHPEIDRVNDGTLRIDFDSRAPVIAIEIPENWTLLQQLDLDSAQHWRAVTDRLFTNYIGIRPGQYAVTGVGADGDRRYLLAERADDALWERLGRK